MINRLEIRNWQSLVKVDLDLGQFTVIVGESSCGKTALMRAIKALASNVRGSSSITVGAKATAITARTANHVVTLQRSTTDGGRYVITDVQTGKDDTYTKLAGAVPPAVTAALGIAPAVNGLSLNVAGQFEPPYLLRESGAAIARLLGDLTNVSTILRAVQEANRRKNAELASLRLREQDLKDKLERAKAFVTLRGRLDARARAEAHAETANSLTAQITALRGLVETLAVAEGVLARSAVRPSVPDDTPVRAAVERLSAYKTQLQDWVNANNQVANTRQRAVLAAQAETAASQALDQALAAAGYCPTCGQKVTHDHALA